MVTIISKSWIVLAGSMVLAVMSLLAACQDVSSPNTELFDQAEEQLQRGDYDEAIRNYEAFIERYPNSPLLPIARQRLANIERELEAVMGRRANPAPIYIRPPEPQEVPSRGTPRNNRWDRSGH